MVEYGEPLIFTLAIGRKMILVKLWYRSRVINGFVRVLYSKKRHISVRIVSKFTDFFGVIRSGVNCVYNSCIWEKVEKWGRNCV